MLWHNVSMHVNIDSCLIYFLVCPPLFCLMVEIEITTLQKVAFGALHHCCLRSSLITHWLYIYFSRTTGKFGEVNEHGKLVSSVFSVADLFTLQRF